MLIRNQNPTPIYRQATDMLACWHSASPGGASELSRQTRYAGVWLRQTRMGGPSEQILGQSTAVVAELDG